MIKSIKLFITMIQKKFLTYQYFILQFYHPDPSVDRRSGFLPPAFSTLEILVPDLNYRIFGP